MVTHYLSINKKLRSEVPNLKIYLVKKEVDGQSEVDVERTREPLSRVGFWLANARHSLA